jgi:hypothetical protein
VAVNTQPDISNLGNRQVQDLAVRSGCWLRSDGLIMDEPIQIEELGHRPPWLATILEDGENRHYVLPEYAAEEQACLRKLPRSMLKFVGQDDEVQPGDDYPHRIGGPIARPTVRALAFMHSTSAQTISGFGRKLTTFAVIRRSTRALSTAWSKGSGIVSDLH